MRITGTPGGLPAVRVASGKSTPASFQLPWGTYSGEFAITGVPVTGRWTVSAFDAWSGAPLGWAENGAGIRLAPNRAVVLRADYNGTSCWRYFASGTRRTPYLAVGATTPAKITFEPGADCLALEPTRLGTPMRPLPGPVIVSTFAPSPWARGATGTNGAVGTSTAGTGAVPVSPWGVPTAARLARVKN